MGAFVSPQLKTLQLLRSISDVAEVNGDSGFENRRTALQALSSMLAGKNEAVPQDMLPQVSACLLECLARHCNSRSALPLDRPSSRYFYTILRTMQAAVSQMDSLQALSLATLVDCLRRFWTYGLTTSRAAPGPLLAHAKSLAHNTPPASPRITSYRPPHLRSQQNAASLRGQWRSRYDEDSASDCSDTESIAPKSDPNRASQVRTSSLTCLQAMAKADGKAMHPLWSAIFPVYTPLSGKPSMTSLMDVIASDPQPKVRAAAAAAAAALMEGPRQRAYLAMAEHHEGHTLRGFTTLSAVLGKMVVCTHEGLLQALSSEADPAALTFLLRFAAVLFGSTPYQRLPPTLLPGTLQDMRRVTAQRVPLVATCAEELAALQCAALACVGALLAAYTCLQLPAASMPKSQSQGGRDTALAGLPDLLAGLAGAPAAAVSAEALAALQPLAAAQPDALQACWPGLRELIAVGMAGKTMAGEQDDAAGAERAAVQGLRLLGCYLRACAEPANSSPACTPIQSPAPGQTMSGIWQAPGDTTLADALEEWSFACGQILMQAVAHERPAVRCAAMAALGSLSQSVYSRLDLAQQRQIWHCIQSCSAECASAVQAAALKALGTLAMCPSSHAYPGLPAMIQIIQEALACPVVSVQVAAAWALANAADTAAGASSCPGHTVASIAQAGFTAAEANEKVQANAVRALGHLLASSHSNGQNIANQHQISLRVPGLSPATDADKGSAERSAGEVTLGSGMSEGSGHQISGGSSAPNNLQHRAKPAGSSEAEATHDINPDRGLLPVWVEPGLRCLIRALQSGSVKVQWNACYAVGALLRCQRAAAAAQRAGLLGQLLQQLLQTLKHSSNFKTRTHAAAAFADVRDMTLVKSVGYDNLLQSLEQASAVLQNSSISKACDGHEQAPKLDVTNIQSYQVLKQQLRNTIQHIQNLRS